MSKLKGSRAPSRRPTPYADLNAILAELVERARTLLAENFVGAYLQGSFALGDFDTHSDVDFIVVTHDDIAPEQLPALQATHDELHALPGPWAPRLEGSYAPKAILRRWTTTPRDPPGEPRPDDWADPGTSGLAPRVY
ncbi:MAG TPA: nucleotidyltransferase domain-containing protein, partial [Caulobacteraceae bacterium]